MASRTRVLVPLPLTRRRPMGDSADNAPDNAPWGAWMEAAQSGDAGAYHRLLVEVSSWLRRYYARRLPPPTVEDAVQDALLAIHEKRHTYDPARPFGPWLAAIARYKWIDRLRALKSAASVELTEDLAVPDHEEAVTSANSLERLLAELKPAQSDVIRMVKLEGLSIEEASARSGQSVSLVKVNIHRGLARLVAKVRGRSDAG
ncbi:MAG TPA: sigma-70 family RNA polymerase sigma factor [Acetobacteraceae bacterium]|nr:sigma-70 family RNA polymerase sigma factor [Acetobacteraceae bacterium]